MVSIVVPVYKAKAVLPRCVESLINQAYRDVEILLVLNGPDDGSGAIAQAYEKEDSRVRIFFQEEGNVSLARNLGIQEAQGEYITFCDADDYVEKEWLTARMPSLIASGAEFDSCAFKEFFPDDKDRIGRVEYRYFEQEGSVSPADFLLELKGKYMWGWGGVAPVWNKIFKTSFVRENGIWNEPTFLFPQDFDFVATCMQKASKIHITNQPVYCYIHRLADSIITRYYPNMLAMYTVIFEKLLSVMPDTFTEEQKSHVYCALGSGAIGGMIRQCRPDTTLSDEEIKDELRKFLALPHMPFLMESYTPFEARHSREIPGLVMAGDIDALFNHCRARAEKRL